MGREIFIWDVHGCMSELEALLWEFEYSNKKDTLFFTGDLIQKWPYSEEVVKFLNTSNGKIHSVMGNHEFHLLKNRRLKLYRTLKKYNLLETLWDLPHWIEWEDFILTHAGFDSNEKLKNYFSLFQKYWWQAPDAHWYASYQWNKLALYGHWAKQWLRRWPHTLGLDTACVDGWYLTAYIHQTWEIVQQICLKKWGYT